MQHTVYLFDGFQLDVTRRKLISSGGLVQPLNSRAMDALLLLVANAGELVEKRRLMQTVWPNAIVEDNNLNQCVLAIRKALGETAGSNRYIMTVPGRGYRFVSPVRAVEQESGSDATASRPRRRTRQVPWLGISATGCVLLLGLLLLYIARRPGLPLAPVVEMAAADRASPTMVLRLRESPVASGTTTTSATALLARCLATHPGMKLRVQVQLVAEEGSPVWTGQYLAGAQDLLALQAGGDQAASGCRGLVAAQRSGEQANSLRQAR